MFARLSDNSGVLYKLFAKQVTANEDEVEREFQVIKSTVDDEKASEFSRCAFISEVRACRNHANTHLCFGVVTMIFRWCCHNETHSCVLVLSQ